ncbi:TadE/TadG family type IV pilus assembly protein [Paenibacillus sp. FSL W8-1187]|nr:TadE/TadG family type IV pilus assembly protein [Paenibacillus sp. B01]
MLRSSRRKSKASSTRSRFKSASGGRQAVRPLFRSLRDERGAQAIEFVGIVPLFLLMVLVVVQFALVGMTAVVAKQAAMEGARAAMVADGAGPHYEQAVRNTAGSYGIREISRSESGEYVTVRVVLESPMVTGSLFGSGWAVPISTQVTVMKEKANE